MGVMYVAESSIILCTVYTRLRDMRSEQRLQTSTLYIYICNVVFFPYIYTKYIYFQHLPRKKNPFEKKSFRRNPCKKKLSNHFFLKIITLKLFIKKSYMLVLGSWPSPASSLTLKKPLQKIKINMFF